MAHLGELRTTRDRARLTRFVKVASVVLGAKKWKSIQAHPTFTGVLIGFTTARNMRAKLVVLVKKAGNHRNKWRALGRKKAASQGEQGLGGKLLSFPTDTQPALRKFISLLVPTYLAGQCCLLLLHVPTPPSLSTGLLQGVMNIRNHKLDPTKTTLFLLTLYLFPHTHFHTNNKYCD